MISLLIILASPFLSVVRAWTTTTVRPRTTLLPATVAPPESTPVSSNSPLQESVLQTIGRLKTEATEYSDMFGLGPPEAAFYALFKALRDVPLGLKGQPILLRASQVSDALGQETGWEEYFGMKDLEKAVTDDFLDAARGSTDNRKGWKITDVSVPRGESFEEARMTFEDVQTALDKGTVIFNAAGAHIPKLANPSLCATDATALPCALNLYITAPAKRTSAPPHTDKQDVVVIQSTGTKHWKVYSPPDPSRKPDADIFARGKGDDSLPSHLLPEWGCALLLETTLHPGDVMLIPAAFPHTTSTVVDSELVPAAADTSIHLTMNFDHHIWELDYLNARRLALRRACVEDTALGQAADGLNPYIGKCNMITDEALRKDLFSALPLGLLEEVAPPNLVDKIAIELERISRAVDDETASAVPPAVWKETIERLQVQGRELFETHRDMYLAAIEEGRTREAEDAMTAHLESSSSSRVLSPERMKRLSLFRVKKYYDQINESKEKLKEWSFAGKAAQLSGGANELPNNWAFTLPVKVGDQVEADLGGAFFPATVSRASGNTYDVQFFDGDRETNLSRDQIKLLAPPATSATSEVDTSNMTPKQLKRWKKEQEKLKKK
uniref:Bifunctional lysine-specific demethylase and histidyl-hydroxylase n=1 Tax=Amphora coffeiformis TaxID=265554 RepID=A0A7S3P829_9STRA|eukprot:scaffold6506_cov171-Amphora_coffeaeformis.AAC.17